MTIKELRQHYNLTQQQLADILECPKRTIENWEAGSRECKPYILKLIEHYLNTADWKEQTNMTYFIADNEGAIYAHDIQSKSKAEAILHDIIVDIGEGKAAELELEILEDEN